MVRKSYGKMRGTRHKLKKKPHTISRYIDTFNVGENVRIDIVSQKNMPNPKFHGMSGRVLERKGNSYLVEVMDQNAVKKIYVKPEHLRR